MTEPSVGVRLVGEARERVPQGLQGRDATVTAAVAALFAITGAALAATLPSSPQASWPVVVLLVLCHVTLCRVEFEIGSGLVLPTQLVLVPMLFLVAPAFVPLLVGIGYVGSALPDVVRGQLHPQRLLVKVSYSWHAIGPALVFGLLHPGAPDWRDWPTYAAALAAQFGFDAASSFSREWIGVGVAPRLLIGGLVRAYLVDALLAPVGFLAAIAATQSRFAFLPLLTVGALLGLLARDRQKQIDEALALGAAVKRARSAARVDRLTGLGNRLAWEEAIEAASLARLEAAHPVSVILIDVDGLKEANDTRGHAFGDTLLQSAAALVSSCVDRNAVVARIGGDELGILLAHAGPEECAAVVARLERAVAARPAIEAFRLSISIGAASAPPAEDLQDTLAVADRRMYAQKRDSNPSFGRARRHFG